MEMCDGETSIDGTTGKAGGGRPCHQSSASEDTIASNASNASNDSQANLTDHEAITGQGTKQ
ncbi:hypothetical protein GCM10009670_30230 [Citricoccus alkalitolerans]